jgi:hypothetical protein
LQTIDVGRIWSAWPLRIWIVDCLFGDLSNKAIALIAIWQQDVIDRQDIVMRIDRQFVESFIVVFAINNPTFALQGFTGAIK